MSASTWIPCSERMPEEQERVLIWVAFSFEGKKYDRGYLEIASWCTAPNGTDWNTSTHQERIGLDEVTHWMPLPEGPA